MARAFILLFLLLVSRLSRRTRTLQNQRRLRLILRRGSQFKTLLPQSRGSCPAQFSSRAQVGLFMPRHQVSDRKLLFIRRHEKHKDCSRTRANSPARRLIRCRKYDGRALRWPFWADSIREGRLTSTRSQASELIFGPGRPDKEPGILPDSPVSPPPSLRNVRIWGTISIQD